jgi:protein associated with RNAse G/E
MLLFYDRNITGVCGSGSQVLSYLLFGSLHKIFRAVFENDQTISHIGIRNNFSDIIYGKPDHNFIFGSKALLFFHGNYCQNSISLLQQKEACQVIERRIQLLVPKFSIGIGQRG